MSRVTEIAIRAREAEIYESADALISVCPEANPDVSYDTDRQKYRLSSSDSAQDSFVASRLEAAAFYGSASERECGRSAFTYVDLTRPDLAEQLGEIFADAFAYVGCELTTGQANAIRNFLDALAPYLPAE